MDDLTTLLHEAVERVEPTDRLAAIRQEARRPSRARWYAVGGVVLATAAVVTGVAIAVQPSDDPGPAPAPQPTAVDSATPSTHAVPVYYLGETPQGLRLFREFHQRTGVASLDEALAEVSKRPEDPDYRTLWLPGGLGPVTVTDGVIRIDVVAGSEHHRKPGMSEAEAELSVQQVIYTVQASVGERLPVQFLSDGNPIDTVLGVPTSEPLANADELTTLALVNISDPQEGREVVDTFSANGVASSFEGTVPWELRNDDNEVVLEGSAQGTMEDHLTPWDTGPIDVSDLPAGDYTFVARTDDPSGGEGGGPTVDTRSITIR